MKLNIISDIHYQPDGDWTNWKSNGGNSLCQIDFCPEKLQPADYLLIAGDLATSDIIRPAIEKVRKETEGKFKKIFYIYGNHDYYDFSYMHEFPRENKYIEEDLGENVVLLGTTLWTPVPEMDEWRVLKTMNDFRAIPNWNLKVQREEYWKQNAWLKEKVDYYKSLGKKVVVMTHHNPRIELHPEYEHTKKYAESLNSTINKCGWGVDADYWVTDHSCDSIKPDIWISGHVHSRPVDTVLDGVRYVKNTIGYNGPWYDSMPELWPHIKHWYDFIIEV